MKFTDDGAKTIPAPTSGYLLLPDEGARGLALRITCPSKMEPTGARAWVFSYRPKAGGGQRRLTIGRLETWPVKKVRAEAVRLRQIVDQGGDPLRERQDEREAPTVAELCDRFEKEHLPRLRANSRDQYAIYLRLYIRPALGDIKVKDVRFEDIDGLHQRITKQGKRPTANRVLAVVSKMMSLAVRWRYRDTNPVRGVERNSEQPRQRYLDGAELGRLMEALGKTKSPSGDAVRLLLLTGARRNEVLSATFDQFDLKDGVWTKPSSHTKQKKEHRIPLSAPARLIVAEMREREESAAKKDKRDPSPFLFPSRGKGETQRQLKNFWATLCGEAGLAVQVERKDRGGKIVRSRRTGKPLMMWKASIRLHDVRHSYASSLAAAGLSLTVIGGLLGHSQSQTTMRYAHLADATLRAATEQVGRVIEAASTGNGGKGKVGS